MIKLGGLQYELTYTVPPERKVGFYASRNRFIREYQGRSAPEHNCSLPSDHGFTEKHGYLVGDSKASGTFGLVMIGVDGETGDLVAIKEVHIKSRLAAKEFHEESLMGQNFRDVNGLLQNIKSWCEHGHPKPCGKIPEKFCMVTSYAKTDFVFRSTSQSKSEFICLRLFCDTLLGLQELHARGIMHRDVTRGNMLVLSEEPPAAVLCDFGKALKSSKDNETRIDPIHTLAPEVWFGSYYDNKIDVWSWAYAILEVLGYKCPTNYPRIDKQRWKEMQSFIHATIERRSFFSGLLSLVEQMLKWDPEQRPSAEGGLRSPCWDGVRDQDGTEHRGSPEQVSGNKRVRGRDDEVVVGGTRLPPNKNHTLSATRGLAQIPEDELNPPKFLKSSYKQQEKGDNIGDNSSEPTQSLNSSEIKLIQNYMQEERKNQTDIE